MPSKIKVSSEFVVFALRLHQSRTNNVQGKDQTTHSTVTQGGMFTVYSNSTYLHNRGLSFKIEQTQFGPKIVIFEKFAPPQQVSQYSTQTKYRSSLDLVLPLVHLVSYETQCVRFTHEKQKIEFKNSVCTDVHRPHQRPQYFL